MTVLAMMRDCRIDPNAVVRDTHNKVARIGESHIETTRGGVCAGIPDCLVTDPVDLVADNRMHLHRIADELDGRLQRALLPAIFDGAAKRFREIVRFLRRRATPLAPRALPYWPVRARWTPVPSRAPSRRDRRGV
jgi:hypothetical protein